MNGRRDHEEVSLAMITPDGEVPVYVPPLKGGPIQLPHPLRIRGRLKATFSGKNYNWSATPSVPKSRAPGSPHIHAMFTEAILTPLGWHAPPQNVRNASMPSLSWGGTLVNTPATVSGREVKDLSFRNEREALFGDFRCNEEEEPIRQGDLTVQSGFLGNVWELYSSPTPSLTTLERYAEDVAGHFDVRPKSPFAPVRLFNHAVLGGPAIWVWGLDNRRIVITEASVITSPDHLMDPVFLGPGCWLLTHPFPDNRIG